MLNMFIKSIALDDQKRVVVMVQEHMSEYLIKGESKLMLKEMAVKILGETFVQLEVSKNSFRVTVTDGTEETAKVKIEEELVKGIEMAMSFMSQMNQNQQ